MGKEWKQIANLPLRIINVLVIIIPIVVTACMIIFWKQIPAQVPLHWGWTGEIDDMSNAGGYIMLVIFMYFILFWHLILIVVVPNFSDKQNLFGKELAVIADEEDRRHGIRIILYMLMSTNVLMEGIFLYIIICGVLIRNLGIIFLPGVLAALCAVFCTYFVRISMLKKEIRLRR